MFTQILIWKEAGVKHLCRNPHPRLWLAVCVRTRHIVRDIIKLYRDIISTNRSKDNMSRSNWIMSRSNWILSRYNSDQSQHRYYVHQIMSRPISNLTAVKFEIGRDIFLPNHVTAKFKFYRDIYLCWICADLLKLYCDIIQLDRDILFVLWLVEIISRHILIMLRSMCRGLPRTANRTRHYIQIAAAAHGTNLHVRNKKSQVLTWAMAYHVYVCNSKGRVLKIYC